VISSPLLLGDEGSNQISRSVRLRASASAYLNRTFSTPTSATIWTWSAWVKRGTLTRTYRLFGASTTTFLTFNSSDQLNLTLNGVSAATSTAVFRDPSAWYHIVYQQNGSAQTIYVNSVSIATGTTAASIFNTAISHQIGAANTTNYFDGYLTEINFIDGQALTPFSFGETDSITGVWKPKSYSGTYGTNGFELNFSDNSASTAATIGKDYSGNGNNWTPNNISVTAGTTYDSMLDVPTPYADGGNGRGNYPTWNPLTAGGLITFSEANLKALSTSASAPFSIESTIKTATTGKWYAEVTMAVGASSPAVGIGNNPATSASNTDQFTAYRVNATYITSGMGASSSGTPATFTTNDVIGIAYDAGAGTLVFYKNGTLQSGGFTAITAGNYSFIVRKDSASGDGGFLNCGQRPFSYTPPTGFVALNTQNLPTPTISNGASYMAATTYTGTGAALTVANTVGSASFQPDLVWVKGRSGATDHAWYDAVRGVQKQIESNSDGAETTETTGLTAFGSTGFTIGALAQMNTNAATYVGWQWNAGGSTVTNTSGSISAQVKANTTAGFSVVTFTGNGTLGATIGHGLGVAPSFITIKNRSAVGNWNSYHASLGATQGILLNSTNATSTDVGFWNNTAPTSTLITLGSYSVVFSNTFVAYCFAAVAGYSAFGSYTGNGSTDGPFVFLGFRPRWVMSKRTDSTGSWLVVDSSRNTYNVVNGYLVPNTTAAEASATWGDFLSNGFKLRGTTHNGSGESYIYACFAENPFKLSLAR